MTLFSIIVPTLWKPAFFPDVCEDLSYHDLVEEIIIVDNNNKDRPTKHPINKNSKIKFLDFGENLYVNPSWNLGVAHSQSPIIGLWNDDVIFDSRLLYYLRDCMKIDHGVYGYLPSCVNGDIQFMPYTTQNPWGFGQLMFIHKKNWIDIPPDILVYCGDNWIIDTQHNKYHQHWLIASLMFHTPGGIGGTSSRNFFHQMTKDRKQYKYAVNEYRLKYQIGFGETTDEP